MSLQEMIAPLAGLVVQAGTFVKEFRQKYPLGTILKADNSPITIADKASHDILVDGLKKYYPDIPTISEEDIPQGAFYAKRFFLIDPIDGTRDYIKGTDNYCINLALIENNRPILGIIYIPEQQELFFALYQQGSFKVENHNVARAVPIKIADYKADMMTMTISHNSKSQVIPDNFMPYLSEYPVIYMGSAQKFTLIAAGIADFYPRMGQTGEWDTASGDILIHEAGGFVVDMQGKKLEYGKKDFLNGAFFAYSHPEFFNR